MDIGKTPEGRYVIYLISIVFIVYILGILSGYIQSEIYFDWDFGNVIKLVFLLFTGLSLWKFMHTGNTDYLFAGISFALISIFIVFDESAKFTSDFIFMAFLGIVGIFLLLRFARKGVEKAS